MKVNPPHITDEPIVARMKRIGIEVGQSFDFAELISLCEGARQRAGGRTSPDEMEGADACQGGELLVMNTDTMGCGR